MLLVSSVAIGIAIGLFVGGKVANLGNLRVRLWPLLFLALLAQVIAFSPPFGGSAFMMSYGWMIYEATLVVTLMVMARNLSLPGMWILLLGSFLNALVIFANGGQMPVDLTLLSQAVSELPATQDPNFYLNTAPMTDSTRLNFLGDVLLVPESLPLRNVFSIGDMLIALGCVALIALTMRQPEAAERAETNPGLGWSGGGHCAVPGALDK